MGSCSRGAADHRHCCRYSEVHEGDLTALVSRGAKIWYFKHEPKVALCVLTRFVVAQRASSTILVYGARICYAIASAKAHTSYSAVCDILEESKKASKKHKGMLACMQRGPVAE